jgi:predicted nucleic acid-binding protein
VLWPIELANALVIAERKKRITVLQREEFLKSLMGLDILVQRPSTALVFREAIHLATSYRLSVYDATHLEIALREGLPIATQDGALIRAANDVAVRLFQP